VEIETGPDAWMTPEAHHAASGSFKRKINGFTFGIGVIFDYQPRALDQSSNMVK
jgi:hypothetical protein